MSRVIGQLILGWSLGHTRDYAIVEDFRDILEQANDGCGFHISRSASGNPTMWVGANLLEIDTDSTLDVVGFMQDVQQRLLSHDSLEELTEARSAFLKDLVLAVKNCPEDIDIKIYDTPDNVSRNGTFSDLEQRLSEPPRLQIVWVET